MGTMPSSRLALLLHPVRIRLVNALQSNRILTTTELCARLPDLPKATIYRHVEQLRLGGVFEVASEQRKRGAVERRYRLVPGGAVIDADAARAMTIEDHRGGFTAAMAALLAEFDEYLASGAKPDRDGVSYRQLTLWLTPTERTDLIREVTRQLWRRLDHQRGPRRAAYRLSTIFFPIRAPGARGKRARR
jgi:hypothetical protein